MADIGCLGWQLEELPTQAERISQVWIEYYRQGQGLSAEEREQRCDLALEHQQLLHQALAIH